MPVSVLTKADFTPRPATEAAGHFAKKVALTHEAFELLSAEAKRHAFRVATVHKARMIQDIRNVVEKAIEQGTDWSAVQRELLKKFDTEGVPRPALYRLRAMFQRNTMDAYRAARREVLDEPEIVNFFPYRMYWTVGDGTPGVNNVRATHAALHGKVFTWDDPIWDAYVPLQEWGCRCTFVGLTAGQAKARGEVIDLAYVRTRIKVPGTERRGIAERPGFAPGEFDLRNIEEELREAVRSMIE
jgi:SPP1 gp7 family putative phage head morphogenesis protein